MTIVQAALSGVLLGGLYALMAAGVSVTWGVLRIINLTHFGLILLGSYLTFELASAWEVNPLVTLAVSVPAMFVLGGAAQWAFDYLRVTELNSLLLSFGLLIIIVQSVGNIWSADFQRMTAAVAGMLFSLGNALTPATAFEWFGTVFAVVILGGIGHLVGTLAAGVLVGLLSSVVSVVLSPATAPFVLFSAIVLALLLRPQGLFAAGSTR
jgi:branched-chain amino acid transport system permease protein